MTKKSLIIASILAATMMAACDDDSSKSEDYIVGGSIRCNGNVSEQYVDGAWKSVVDCASDGRTCSEGVCVSGTYACDEATYKAACDNDTDPSTNVAESTSNNYLRYCSNGEIKFTDCSLRGTGGYCQNAACVSTVAPECENGATRCNAKGDHEVCANGSWKADACASGLVCSAGSCVEDTNHNDCSTNGATRCVGKSYQTCTNNAWTTTKTCSSDQVCSEADNGCVAAGTAAGGCNDAGTDCAAGYASETEVDLSTISIGCGTYNGTDYDAYCKQMGADYCYAEDGEPSNCAMACSKEGETSVECNSYKDGDYYEEYKCMSIGGKLVEFNYLYKACKGTSGGTSGGSSAYEDCSDETCTLTDGSQVKCGDACESAYGSGYKAWCSGTSVTCSATNPGGSSSGGSSSGGGCNAAGTDCADGYGEETSYDIADLGVGCGSSYDSYCTSYGFDYCITEDGEPVNCAESCSKKGEKSEACTAYSDGDYYEKYECAEIDGNLVNVNYYYAECKGSSSSSGGSSAYEDCSDETCTMTDGSEMKCGDACESAYGSGYKAWCSGTSVKCSTTNPGGSSSGGSSSSGGGCNAAGTDCADGYGDETSYDIADLGIGCGDSYDSYCTSYGFDYCLTEDGEPVNCAESCSKKGEKSEACTAYSDGDYYEKYECAEIDGKLVNVNYYYAECNGSSSGGSSSAESCNEDTYQEKCDGNVVVYCDDGEVSEVDCDEYTDYYGVDYSCLTIDGIANCYSDDDKCSKAGETKTVCTYYYGYPVTYDYECSKASNGKLYWSMVDGDYCDGGKGYCSDSSTCHAAETCSADSYAAKCDGDTAYSCDSGYVSTTDCNEYTEYYGVDYSCHVAGGVSGCFSADDTCTKEGESSQVCEDFYGLLYYVTQTSCAKAEDGKLYQTSVEHYCANACNSAGTDCDSAGYDD